jgi:hypothetical protein
MSVSADGQASRYALQRHCKLIDINARFLKNCAQVPDTTQIVLLATPDIALSVPVDVKARIPKYQVPEPRFSTT